MAFEFDGEKYKQASTHQKEWGAKLISEFTLQGTEHILDLGCGDGAITADLADRVPDGSVVGIDASRGMIKTAQQNHQKANLKFELLDIGSIQFTNEFDIILSNAALHWVRDHEALLHNVYVALKDNGKVRFNFAADGNCSSFYKVVREVMLLPEYSAYFSNFVWPWFMPSIEAYQSVAELFPFSEVEIWGENGDRYFSDKEEMIRWIDQPSIVPFLECIHSEKSAKNFRDNVVEKMIQETIQKDGTCFETFRRINLKGDKRLKA